MNTRRLHIQTLGTFKLRAEYMDEPIELSLTGRPRRLWTLVAYLVANRGRGVPAQELIEILWPISAGANPLSRLQNNVSRVRSTLASLGFKDAENMIRCESGLYYWAPDYKLVLDIDTLEKNVAQLENSEMNETAVALAWDTINMYEGDFLGRAVTESWAVNTASYYRTLVIGQCQRLIDKLVELDRYQDVERACLRALELAPSTEKYSVQLMRAYVAQGAPQKALDHYDYIKKLLHDLYEVAPSLEIEAEREVALQAIHGEEVTENDVIAFLNEENGSSGAFFCSNAMFREIAQLHLREVKRYGTSAQLAILRIREANANPDNGPERQALHLRRLRGTISETLRASDPFTKMSSSQLLVLLPGATRANAAIAIERVLNAFRKNYPFANVELIYTLIDMASLAE